MNTFLKYLLQFVVGGSIIVGMSLLAKYAHPKFAALLYALPIQFTLAAIFIYLDSDKGTIQELSENSLYYIAGFVCFIIAFYLLTRYFDFWSSLVISYLLFIGVTLLVLKFLS